MGENVQNYGGTWTCSKTVENYSGTWACDERKMVKKYGGTWTCRDGGKMVGKLWRHMDM